MGGAHVVRLWCLGEGAGPFGSLVGGLAAAEAEALTRAATPFTPHSTHPICHDRKPVTHYPGPGIASEL